MKQIILIAIAGAFGTLARYGISLLALKLSSGTFPFGTLIVNVIGCFLIGVLMYTGNSMDSIAKEYRLALAVGFLGAFTTFSTFSLETVKYLQNGLMLQGALNVALNFCIGLPATVGGFLVGKATLGS